VFKKQEKRHRRHKRVRAKIFGTAARPRLCVFKSGKHIYAQLINDDNGRTLVAASDLEIKGKSQKPKVKTTKRKIETEK
jgi:large subunit ribosomal protein L18